MTKRHFYIAVAIICTIGFLILLFAIFAEANSGKIIVYDEEGKVIHVEKFGYTPDKRPYVAPKVITNRPINTNAPPAPTGMRLVTEPEQVHIVDRVNEGNDDIRLRKGSKKKTRWFGRTRKIKKIEYGTVDGKAVTIIHRKETDKRGRVYKTQEVTVDNRYDAKSVREQKKASDNAPPTKKIYTEQRIR